MSLDFTYFANPSIRFRLHKYPKIVLDCDTVVFVEEEDKHECGICFDSIVNGQDIRLLKCGHMFHKKCIKSWFKRQRNCPFCRAVVGVRNIYCKKKLFIKAVYENEQMFHEKIVSLKVKNSVRVIKIEERRVFLNIDGKAVVLDMTY